jgi:hypothetical protein
MTAPGEVTTPILVLEQGETYTVDEDGAVVITGEHTHSDILRYVVSEIGSDARSLLEDILTGEDAATLGLSGETQTDDRTRRDA